jgi:hypothetical protein
MSLDTNLPRRAWLAIWRALLVKELHRQAQSGPADGHIGVFASSLQAAQGAYPPAGFTPRASTVATLTTEELLQIKNCGPGTVRSVRAWLEDRGLTLRDALPPDHEPLTANVYADWLDEQGEPSAAAKLRKAFPLDAGHEIPR